LSGGLEFFFMLSTLTKQSVFSFCLLINVRQKNGVVFYSDNKRKIAKKLGLSLTSFNKYFKKALELDLFVKRGENYQLIAWHKIAKKLGLLERTYRFYDVLLLQKLRTMSFHQLRTWVRESLVLYKLYQQDFKLKMQQKTIDAVEKSLNVQSKGRGYSRRFNKFRIEANSIGRTTDMHYECVKEEQRTEIVTGCNHLSKLFGNCKATMNNALKGLVKRNIIERKILKVEHKGITHANFDRLKRSCNGLGLYPNYSKDCFVVILGSTIKIISTLPNKRYKK